MNKSAYSKVLAKLAQNKVAGSEVPNQVRLMDATESGKGQSGYDSGSSHGNGNRSLVNTSNERAMSYTKADAKKSYNKEQMSQVFDEVHPEKDNALDRAFAHGVDTAKMAGVTGNMGASGLIGGGLREGVSSLGGKALGGLAGLATKGKGLIEEYPNAAGIAGVGAAALGGRAASNALDLDQNGVGETIGGNIRGKMLPGVAATIGGGLAGATAGKHIYNNRERALAEQAMAKQAMGIESFNHESSLADTIDSMKDRTKVKHAGVEDAKKLKAMAEKEIKEEKAEEKLVPSIHKKIEKEASLVSKGAILLRKLAEAVPTNIPPQAAVEQPAQGGVPPEDAQEMGGQEDQIEKLKKLLLLMQMAKKQEEQQMMQGQSAMPDVASPGGAAANEMAAATSGPAQGIM
jgi:hypothetical protein